MTIKLLDCTLRDGGYYNSWNFSEQLIADYLDAMAAAGVDIVELGLRSLGKSGFRGACAYTTDDFLARLEIPGELEVGVMVNAAELLGEGGLEAPLEKLFPQPADTSPVSLVRVACHIHELESALPASQWLHDRGYRVGFNLMQVAACSAEDLARLAGAAARWPLDVLYFADSMGSMSPADVSGVIDGLRAHWQGPMGIHTHDNMGMALQNTLHALESGVTWLDATVTGMGRGPGNAQMEFLAIEMGQRRDLPINAIPLMRLVREHFKPMQEEYGWGTNPYYYLAGKYGIHPTYIQEMLGDSRYSAEDILAVIEHLKVGGGRKFSLDTLDSARHFYQGEPCGSWDPASELRDRDVLLLGAGPGVSEHSMALESYIRRQRPLVIALNTQSAVDESLIDMRAACHPVRLLADRDAHLRLPQPLITPASMLPEDVKDSFGEKRLLDYGMAVESGRFAFSESHCVIPVSLVVAYALAVACSGEARRVLMAGFDGFPAGDPRFGEMQEMLDAFSHADGSRELISITPTAYAVDTQSIYAL